MAAVGACTSSSGGPAPTSDASAQQDSSTGDGGVAMDAGNPADAMHGWVGC
jgi:hypothetical protein